MRTAKLGSNKKIFLIVSTIVMLFLVLLIGPVDTFSHGFYSDEIDLGQVFEIDKLGIIDIAEEEQIINFIPQEKHFAGFEIYLVNQPAENMGQLLLSVSDSFGNQIDRMEIDLSEVNDSQWYKVHADKELKKDVQYTLTINSKDALYIPAMMLIDDSYLSEESLESNILIKYAYEKSTFSFQEKILIAIFAFSIWGICNSLTIESEKLRRGIGVVSVFMLLTACLSWNYMFCSMDNQNNTFKGFQEDSEMLVTGMIYAERDDIYSQGEQDTGFGLGWYIDPKGEMLTYEATYLTDNDWLEGYSRTMPSLLVRTNRVTNEVAVVGNSIRFNNGDEYEIIGAYPVGDYYVIHLNADRMLSKVRNGSLDDVVFLDNNHQPIKKSSVNVYQSQYGLQGKVFQCLSKYMEEDNVIQNLHLLCSIATAMVFSIITLLLVKKYNLLFAGCFFMTFWLSPWVVNYARNLYWVEFTWFLPMLVGLFCAWKIDSKKCRIISYVATFVAIVGKCLCGYEYLSTIMMGLVAFLVADLVAAWGKKDKEKSQLLFRATFIVSVVALTGFAVALCIHATLRGDGSMAEGIKTIINEDVLRRTNGANLNNFDSIYWPSMNASVWEVFCRYFRFSTEIITGVAGNLFPVLCVLPLGIFAYEIKSKRVDFEALSLYVVFFMASISWFCLAKSHSYIHVKLNYVMWYMGFVQICFYIIASRFIKVCRREF